MTSEQLQRARQLIESVSAWDGADRADIQQRERSGAPVLVAMVEQMIVSCCPTM
jgi:hypothetical protein